MEMVGVMKASTEARPGPGSMDRSRTYSPAVAALRDQVLRALNGTVYRTIREIPRQWPVQRVHVAAVVRMLRDEGLLEEAPDPRYGGRTPAYRAIAVPLKAPASVDAASR
ncbi:MAG: hypothetical protein P8174_06935 [Gemmatimonadota bacterium]